MTPLVRLVTATRESRSEFWQNTLLGQSLRTMAAPHGLEITIHEKNRRGLSELYNTHLLAPDERPIVFVHDDVYLHDVFLAQRVREGLRHHTVLGLAGSSGGDPSEPSWALAFDQALQYRGWQVGPDFQGVRLSGTVGHVHPSSPPGEPPRLQLSNYGPSPAEVSALDGLLLIVDPVAARSVGLTFDERFTWHCYDVDFTRRAFARGLSVSTWPILVSHGSPGNFGSEEWRDAARLYRQKWSGELETPSPAPAPTPPNLAPPPPISEVSP